MNTEIRKQAAAELEWIEAQTNGAPYELWLSAGGVYVVMARRLAALLSRAVRNILEADRVFCRDAIC